MHDTGYIAHIDPETGISQPLSEHCRATATLCKDFSVEPLKEICYLIGLLHDIGKYLPLFQRRIRGEQISVEHSICGAQEVCAEHDYSPAAILMALCIAGHHAGIPDCGTRFDTTDQPTLFGRLRRSSGNYHAYKKELAIPRVDPSPFVQMLQGQIRRSPSDEANVVELFAFLTRYCFSCLTDADSIDSASACGFPSPAPLWADFSACEARLDGTLRSFPVVDTPLGHARSSLQKQAFSAATGDARLFLMNMPTGSGKTLASMRCALRLVRERNLRRIIYIIPYNSIIDQTVRVFEQIFSGSAKILRHQSSFSYDIQPDMEEDERLAAVSACENWDAQIIVTTAVQFFESVHGNTRRKLRKLHNMAHSVLVFDEAHLMPSEYMEPCLRAVAFITEYLNSTAIFLTATMPNYRDLIRSYAAQDIRIRDLITDTACFSSFQTNTFHNLGPIADEQLVQLASASPSCLIVMNTRKGARKVFELCTGQKYHLSTYMTGMDRARVIEEIRLSLAELEQDYPALENVPPQRRITVVSTSLIEAGVDLDFSDAYRELNGLDNILQTAGRCNREGKRVAGTVRIFERIDDAGRPLSLRQSITQGILKEFRDIASPGAVAAYYDRLFFTQQDLHSRNALHRCCNPCKYHAIPFRTYSESFHLIDDDYSVSIVVCQDETSEREHERLRLTGYVDHRIIQQYCCSVPRHEFELLLQQGVLKDYKSGVWFLENPDYYDAQIGLCTQGHDIII